MAQKQKLRPSPLDEPPTASSSSSEEEDQQPSSQQHEEDAVSSGEEEEEEEASSQEDDGEEEEDLPPAPKNTPPPPPPTNPHPQPSSSESDTETGSETESEPDPIPAKVKPLASKPMDQAQKPKPQPSPAPPKSGPKRPAENNAHVTDPKRAKKKSTNSSSSFAAAAASDDETEEDGKKSGDNSKKPQRLWSEEDELAILKGVVEFSSKTGQDPLKFANANAFHDFMKRSLHVEVSSNQLKEKVRRLKKKFETNAGKGKNGEGPTFSKPHDQKAFELSKKVWGSEQGGGANGPVEKPKSNGNAAKSPKKKETGSRNVASAKKLKPETKLELAPVPVPADSLALKESGMMDIDQKPGSGCGSSLWREISRRREGVELDEDELKRGLELIGESKRAELEGKWKKIRLAEIELVANRSLLIGEQTKLIAEALQSSGH
ncbi:Mediator-associated protein 1 [Spatholobus suberectus]|nr:Mediator-associated protein 1 [Spatholobus suberectus]